jgi:hypothetical protein
MRRAPAVRQAERSVEHGCETEEICYRDFTITSTLWHSTAVSEKSEALSLTTAEQLGVRRSSHQDFGMEGVNSVEGGLQTTNMAIT